MQTFDMNAEEVISGMQEEVDIFASVLIPETYTLPFPPILRSFWYALVDQISSTSNRFPKSAIGIPRGHAKSTVIKLFICYCILFTDRKFIAVICAKASLAENILMDVMDMLSSPNVQTLFGRWDLQVKRDRTDSKIFHFRGRQIVLAAIGASGSFRGMNLGNERPDMMIFDDAQSKDCAESMAEADAFISWFTATAMKAKSPTRCAYIYVGNMYKELPLSYDDAGNIAVRGCLLHNLHLDPAWTSYISGAILADGTCLWPELHSLETLLEELAGDTRLGKEDEWFAEVQNDPTFKKHLHFDIGKVPIVAPEIHQTGSPHSAYMILDPSLGKKKSDDQAVGIFRIYDEIPILEEIHVFKQDIKLLTKELIDLAVDKGIPVIFTEDYGMQSLVNTWFNHWIDSYQLEGLTVRGINRGKLSKTQAVLDYMRALMAGSQLLAPAARSKVLDQASNFDVTRTDNKDDILDVGYYGNLIVGNPELKELTILPYYISSAFGGFSVESSNQSSAVGASGSYLLSYSTK